MAWALDETRVTGTAPLVFASVLAGRALLGEKYEPSAFGLPDDAAMQDAVAAFDLPFVKVAGSGVAEQPADPTKAESRTSTGEVAAPPQPDGDLTRAALDRAAELGSESAPEATESAKDLAAEKGVDIATVEGSGSGGRVTKADVEAAAEAAPGGGE